MFRTLYNPGVFWILAYSKPEAYQNRVIFRTPKYSEPCQTSTIERFANIVNNYNDFRNISFLLSLLCEKKCFFNTCLIFTPEVFILCKKERGPRGPETVNFWYNYLSIYSNELAYLQLITVSVYGSSC